MAARARTVVGIALSTMVAHAAAALEVALPASTAIAGVGQPGAVALSIGPLTAVDMVFAGAVSFTYSGSIVSATGATPSGLLAGCTTTTNLTAGRVTLIFACVSPLTNGGTLFTVDFTGVAVGVSPLVFSPTNEIPNGCVINEGTPACQSAGGEVVVGSPPATATVTATVSGVATATITATASGVVTATTTRTPTATAPIATPTGGAPPSGQLVQDVYRASDGTAYQLARVLPQAGPNEAVRVTTVAGSVATVGGCSATGSTVGSTASAIAGAPAPQPLIPYATVVRTAILLPSNAGAVSFDSVNSGRLRLGSGASVATVCADPFDCIGQPGVAQLFFLDSVSGGAAAACIGAGLQASCDGGNDRAAFAFGLASTGSPPLCTAAPTIATTVCAAEPSDGFRLATGQVIVFIYGGDLAASGFSAGIAGFGIDLDGTNPFGCAAGAVVSATDLIESIPAPPPRTPTATPPPTPTRIRPAPAIPVIPSPLAGAGILLIGGLAAALLLTLRARAAGRE